MSATQRNFWIGLAICLAGYVGSTQITALAIPFAYGIDCSAHLFSVKCAFPADVGLDRGAYGVLGVTIATALGLLTWRGRDWVAYPFMMTLGVLAGGAICYDLVADRPILNPARIINGTINILGFVIFASFVLTLAILRQYRLSHARLAVAVIQSYALKTIAVTLFIGVMPLVYGATELLVLYIVYAFGAFTLHIMTVSSMVGSLRGPAVAPAGHRA